MRERQHRASLLAFGLVGILAALSLASPPSADASPGASPSCVRVPLGEGQFRLYLDPGATVAGEVTSVRSGRTAWTPRADGVWISTQPRLGSSDWHVVIKSDADRFSERRYSGWAHCTKVRPGH